MGERTLHADSCVPFRRQCGRQAPRPDLADQRRPVRNSDLSGFEDQALGDIACSHNQAALPRVPMTLQIGALWGTLRRILTLSPIHQSDSQELSVPEAATRCMMRFAVPNPLFACCISGTPEWASLASFASCAFGVATFMPFTDRRIGRGNYRETKRLSTGRRRGRPIENPRQRANVVAIFGNVPASLREYR